LGSFSRAAAGIVLLLLLGLTLTYAETQYPNAVPLNVYVLNIDEYSRDTRLYWVERTEKDILGVKVKMELHTPMILINGESHTFMVKISVGEAPSAWSLNMTEIAFEPQDYWTGENCGSPVVESPMKVLRGGDSFTKQFTVTIEKKVGKVKEEPEKLAPGHSSKCPINVRISYLAQFGANKEKSSIGIGLRPIVKSKELPLELKPNLSVLLNTSTFFAVIHIIGSVVIKNVQSQEIVLKHYYICSFLPSRALLDPRGGLRCSGEKLSSIVVKPGEEYVLNIKEDKIFLESPQTFLKMDLRFDWAFIIEYLNPDGEARNWVGFIAYRQASKETAQQTTSPTTAATPKATPTAIITKTEATATRTTRAETIILTATTPSAGAPSSDFTLALILVPIVVAAATATVFAVRWLRKAPT
jgi:hypothetical protein